jgi:hypothetical protein
MNHNIPVEFVENTENNTNNLKEYYPFLLKNGSWNVDKKWFSLVHPSIQNLFKDNVEWVDFKFPHEYVSKQQDIECKIPYKEVTLDVYYDKETQNIFLIECNPFGAWSAAGSSLFEWKKDYDILYGICSDRPPILLKK